MTKPDNMSLLAIELQGIRQEFGALVAINDISLSVSFGERRAILGANGAGKTTLFNAITGDFLPQKGKILFFGEDITRMPVCDRIRRGLRRTYQKSLLFQNLTVKDNLYLAVRGVLKGHFSLKSTGNLKGFKDAVRKLAVSVHLDKLLDVKVGNLSHGQQRQLEIGMAMAGEPRLILFDEPAAGLSSLERTQLEKLLLGLPPEITFIIIEHDLNIALKVSDKITILHNGNLFKEGTTEKIKKDPEVQSIYLGNSG